MRIIGIDPGIARTGIGIIDEEKGKISALHFTCLETLQATSLPNRLQEIFTQTTEILKTYRPDVLAIEELFFNTNAKTAFIVGQARGVILLTAAEKNIPVATYTPLQVKIAVTGYGRAEKKQVGQMVQTILHLSSLPKLDDTTDALAVALTHAFSYRMSSSLR